MSEGYERLKRWKAANPERYKNAQRRHYERNLAEIKVRQALRYKEKREEILAWNNAYYSRVEPRMKELIGRIRRHCVQRAIPLDLTEEKLLKLWDKQKGRCAITGIELSLKRGEGRKREAASLDRIVPELGYVEGNVRFICDILNIMKQNMTDKEFRKWCIRVVQGLEGQANICVPNLDAFGDLVDRLIIELLKLSWYEQEKRREQASEKKNAELIARYDDLSRDANEYRAALKNRINLFLRDMVTRQSYLPLEEVRTFRAPKRTVEDLLEEMIENRINESLRAEFTDAILTEVGKIRPNGTQ